MIRRLENKELMIHAQFCWGGQFIIFFFTVVWFLLFNPRALNISATSIFYPFLMSLKHVVTYVFIVPEMRWWHGRVVRALDLWFRGPLGHACKIPDRRASHQLEFCNLVTCTYVAVELYWSYRISTVVLKNFLSFFLVLFSFIRRKYFYSDQNVDIKDPVQLGLLFVQVMD